MEGTYFYGEYLRWNLGWENPNPAGAFVATLLPWCWGFALVATERGGRKKWGGNGAILLAEGILLFLLCKTYSRGALVALVAAMAMFGGTAWWRNGGSGVIFWVVPRLVLMATLLWATGFLARVEPTYVAGDASAMNRLSLWQGGMQMIAASPWHGWGEGGSGAGFMHWFQALDSDEAYAGMVNSYLHVAVERGLPTLAAVLGGAGALLILALGSSGREGWSGAMQLGAAASLAVFLVANVFSTLWIFGNLWWVPLVAGIWILAGAVVQAGKRFPRVMTVALTWGGSAGCVAATALWVAGLCLEGEVKVVRESDGSIRCGRPDGQVGIVLLADPTVLGESWGKEVRRLAGSSPSLVVKVPAGPSAMATVGFDGRVIACGARAEEGLKWLAKHPKARLLLIHPLGKPLVSPEFSGEVRLKVPGLDAGRHSRRWRVLARNRGWVVEVVAGVGQDVRTVWPEVAW